MSIRQLLERIGLVESRSGIEYSVVSSGSRHFHYPNFNLNDYEKYYLLDPVVFSAINSLADMIVGAGFYTEAEDEKAKQIVDEFCERVNMDEKLRDVARYVLLYGDAFMEKIFEKNKLVDVKVWSPKGWRILLDKKRNIIGYEKISNTGVQKFAPEEIVHFRFVRVGDNEFGVSLIQPALEYIKAKYVIAKLIPKVFLHFASPLIVFRFGMEREAQRFKQMLEEKRRVVEEEEPDVAKLFNEIITYGKDVQAEPVRIDFRSQLIDYIKWLDENFIEGFRAPLMRYLYNATEASARVIYDAIQQTPIEALQRHIKRKIESEIFKPLIEQEGLEEVPRLNWGVPKSVVDDLSLNDIIQIWDREPDYAIKLLMKKGFPPLEEEEELEERLKRVKEVNVETNPNVLQVRLFNKLSSILTRIGKKVEGVKLVKEQYDDLIAEEMAEAYSLIDEYVFLGWFGGRYVATRSLGKVSFGLTQREMKTIEEQRSKRRSEFNNIVDDYIPLVLDMGVRKAKMEVEFRLNAFTVECVYRPYNHAKYEIWLEAAEGGQEIVVVFTAAADERTCRQCMAYHGRKFVLGRDVVPIPPLHPNCRCTLMLLKK